MTIDRTSGVPAYRQVAASIRERIESGDYQPGDPIPSEREMVEGYGVSRVTIRDAIQLLRNDGVLVAEHGRGVFVKAPAIVTRLSRNRLSRTARAEDKGTFLADAATASFTPSSSVEIRFEPADQTTAEALGLPDDAEVCVRDRVMRANGLVVQLAVSRLPRDLTRGTQIEEVNTGQGGIYARLEEAGHQLDHFTEAVRSRMPTTKERSLLQLGDGQPVLVVNRIAYTFDRAVEINTMVMAADRYELVYNLPAE